VAAGALLAATHARQHKDDGAASDLGGHASPRAAKTISNQWTQFNPGSTNTLGFENNGSRGRDPSRPREAEKELTRRRGCARRTHGV
jgi:hypothetical protein